MKTKEIVFSIPGWLSVKLEPNQAEQRAAWSLYVEISTRIASQPFNRDTGKMRDVLTSLQPVRVHAANTSGWRA